MSKLEAVTDVSPAQWLVDAVSGNDLSVGQLVSPAFEAYVRILHPVDRVYSQFDEPAAPPSGPFRWSEIASRTGRQMHRLVQFDPLVGVSRYAKERAPYEAEIGSLDQDLYTQVRGRLASHTTAPGTIWFGLWEGWGWVAGSPSVVAVSTDGRTVKLPPAFDREIIEGPRVSIPEREYILLTGPIDSWESLFDREEVHEAWQSPSLMWPEDRSWCLATEIDFDSTYIGGSADLIAELLSDPKLEAFPAEPEDEVHVGADKINPQPPER